MAPHADFVFVAAPFEARGPADDVIERLYQGQGPFYEWGHVTKLDRQPNGSDNGWYHRYVGFDRVVDQIDKQLQDHGPFDAAVGFSQAQRAPLEVLPHLLGHPRTRCWFASAFRTPDGSPKRMPIPSIHLLGEKGQYYNTCREHAELYADNPPDSARSGHRFPSDDRYPELYEKISDIIRQHCGHAATSNE